MATKQDLSGITRIDHENTHGWYVRKTLNGKQKSKLFSDLKLGGKNKSLTLALSFRDQLVKEMGPTGNAQVSNNREKKMSTTTTEAKKPAAKKAAAKKAAPAKKAAAKPAAKKAAPAKKAAAKPAAKKAAPAKKAAAKPAAKK